MVTLLSSNLKITHREIEEAFNDQDQSMFNKLQVVQNIIGNDGTLIEKKQNDQTLIYKLTQPITLNFAWKELRITDKNEVLKSPPVKEVQCHLHAPLNLELVKVPLTVEIHGEIAPVRPNCIKTPLKLEQMVRVKYVITNTFEDTVFECVSVLDDENKYFFISGEIKSKLYLMPLESVELNYVFLPLYLGHFDLPKLHILDRSTNPDILKINIKKLTDKQYLDEFTEKGLAVDYLIKGFTFKTYV